MDDFFETAPLGIHVADADGRLLRANAVELELLGRSIEECVGRPLADFHVDPAVIDGLLARLRRGETVRNLESRVRRKDGTVRWIRMSANPVMEGGALVRSHVFSRDVTGAKEAEAALRTREDHYHGLVEGTGEYAVHGLDPEGRVATWNPGAESLYGWTEHEILGRHLSALLAPEDVAGGLCERMLRLACNEGRFRHEGWRTRKEGSRFWADVTLTALRNADGRVCEIAHVTRDASERRRLDALRRKAGDLMAANLVIMDAQRKAVHLLGTVASRLDAPIAAIERAAARLRSPRVPAKTRIAAGAAVEDGVSDLRRELARWADRAKAEGEEADLLSGTVDLLRLAVEARELLREAALAREVRVVVDVDPELSSVLVNNGHLELILYNLLAHAIQSSREGGLVGLRVLPEGSGAIRIEAEDAGRGLSPDEVDRLLRGEDVARPSRPAGGPWIAPTKRIVDEREGRLAVKSVLGRGSVVSVVLPRKRLVGRAPSGSVEVLAGRARAGLVLVVADSATARASLAWGFGSAGWTVIHVVSVDEAISVLRSHTFDVVAVDLTLGQIGAVEFVTRLRRDGLSRSVPHVLAVIHAAPSAWPDCSSPTSCRSRPRPTTSSRRSNGRASPAGATRPSSSSAAAARPCARPPRPSRCSAIARSWRPRSIEPFGGAPSRSLPPPSSARCRRGRTRSSSSTICAEIPSCGTRRCSSRRRERWSRRRSSRCAKRRRGRSRGGRGRSTRSSRMRDFRGPSPRERGAPATSSGRLVGCALDPHEPAP